MVHRRLSQGLNLGHCVESMMLNQHASGGGHGQNQTRSGEEDLGMERWIACKWHVDGIADAARILEGETQEK